jgi:hypothetical protein
MKKSISFDEFQSVKRVAQACNPLKVKRDKVQAKIEALQAEYNAYDTQISALEAGIKSIIGFRTEELVKKIIVPGTDKNGKEIKTTKYVPTDIVTYDKDKKQYVITIPDASEANEDTNASDTEEEVSEDAQQSSNE